YSAILLAWCEAFYIWAFAISYWAKENTQLSGLIILLLSSIIMIYTLFSLPGRNKKPPYSLNIASHFILILSYIFIWTLFLYKSNGYFQALRPLETLIVPLLAWLVFTNFSKYLGAIESLYRHQISVILAIYCVLWLIIANFIHPTARVYIPLLNTIEIGSIAVLCQLWLWHDKSLPENYEKEEITRYIFATIALSGLFLISCAVMRFWHYYNGVEWNSKALLSSFGVQATLSIIWAITAIVIMVIANRQQRRNLWITGAILMAIVVGKLFLVELANSGGIERIVSFIAVGLLLLFVGWFAPVPPRE
ncbi:MAG: DUF2339 domain-containing protein, partial [Neisseriaceae bacterium]|nr:DUF2339 domain-containing protein [Neisseriaceae bacterium]